MANGYPFTVAHHSVIFTTFSMITTYLFVVNRANWKVLAGSLQKRQLGQKTIT